MWFSPQGRAVRKGRKGKGEGRVAAVTREEDTLSHHILSLSRRRGQESRGSSSEALPSECQNQLTWEDRQMEESHTEAEPVLGVLPSLGGLGGVLIYFLPITHSKKNHTP